MVEYLHISSYMSLHPIPSECPHIRGKFCFLLYQCPVLLCTYVYIFLRLYKSRNEANRGVGAGHNFFRGKTRRQKDPQSSILIIFLLSSRRNIQNIMCICICQAYLTADEQIFLCYSPNKFHDYFVTVHALILIFCVSFLNTVN